MYVLQASGAYVFCRIDTCRRGPAQPKEWTGFENVGLNESEVARLSFGPLGAPPGAETRSSGFVGANTNMPFWPVISSYPR
jgi:hypothetical protein